MKNNNYNFNQATTELIKGFNYMLQSLKDSTTIYDGVVISNNNDGRWNIQYNGEIHAVKLYGNTLPTINSIVKVIVPQGNQNLAWFFVIGESGTGSGTTFIPSVSEEGIISWTNDGDLPNPDPVNIKGPQGDPTTINGKTGSSITLDYNDVGAAPSGYGLGTSSVTPEGDDLNNAILNGWYTSGESTLNKPTGAVYCVVRTEYRTSNGIVQYAYDTLNHREYRRYKTGSGASDWSAWEKTWPLTAADIGATNALQQNVTLYVSPSGSDTTGNGSESNPYQTITYTLSQIPKNLNGYTAQIFLSEGTYNESVTVSNFYNGGRISSYNSNIAIIGGNNLANALNYSINGNLTIMECDNISITGVNIIGDNHGVTCRNVKRLYLRYIQIINSGSSGIFCVTTNGTFLNCVISNKTSAAIIASEVSVLSCYYISGSNNEVGYQAGYSPSGTCGIIMLGPGNTLSATTLTSTYGGSQVFQ